MTKEKAKGIFTVHTNGQDSFIKIDKRQFDNFIDLIYDSFEEREIFLATKDLCNDRCKHYLSDNGNYPLAPCSECSRFYADKWESK